MSASNISSPMSTMTSPLPSTEYFGNVLELAMLQMAERTGGQFTCFFVVMDALSTAQGTIECIKRAGIHLYATKYAIII